MADHSGEGRLTAINDALPFDDAAKSWQDTKRTVIIGGGITGVAAFISLIGHQATAGVDIIDPGPVGLGKAFATTHDSLLCNTSVETMSLFAEDQHDFLNYLRSQHVNVRLNDFVPRSYVSRYAKDLYRDYCRKAAVHGISHRHIKGKAISIRKEGHKSYRVLLEDGSGVCAGSVLICVGFGAPIVPKPADEHIGEDLFFETPYPEQALLSALPPRSSVLVIGTRLSAIDAALLLCGQGHRVVMTSRSGELPAVRTRTPRLFPSRIDEAMVAGLDPVDPRLRRRLISLLCRSATAVRTRPLGVQVTRRGDPVARLRAEIDLAAADMTDWQDILVNSLDAGNVFLSRQAPDVRSGVLDACRDFVQRYLFAFPLENARALLNFIDKGLLRIVPGAPVRLDRQGTWMASWAQLPPEPFHAVVCAAGFQKPRFHAEHDRLELVTDASRLCAVPSVSAALQVTLPGGPAPERIWTLGVASYLGAPLVNAVYQAAQQADAVARHLAAEADQSADPAYFGQAADDTRSPPRLMTV